MNVNKPAVGNHNAKYQWAASIGSYKYSHDTFVFDLSSYSNMAPIEIRSHKIWLWEQESNLSSLR